MKKILRCAAALLCCCAMLLTSVDAISVQDARRLLEENYIYELPAAAQKAATLDELFSYVTDPYTYYMTQEKYQEFLDSVEGNTSVTGIGASISYTNDGIELLSILPNSGAEEVGLTAGDMIIAIDGVSCVPSNETHRMLLVGEAGTNVSFTVRHMDGSVEDYTVTRRTITIINTTVSAKGGIGYIDCNSFGTETGQYFIDGIKKYDESVHDWIIDLRGNSGGVASSAVTALGTFIGGGALLYYKNRAGNIYGNYYWDTFLTERPAIVLTNAYSASASEIFAGGIAGGSGGIVVGSRTYGKGVAQKVYNKETDDCFDNDALKVTVYRFYCVNGNTTDMIGVIPTLVVSNEQTKAVAELLCGIKPGDGSAYLHLVLNGYSFYVNLANADQNTLSALIDALAPDAEVYYGTGGSEVRSSVDFLRTVCQYNGTDRGFTDVTGKRADEINALAVYEILRGDGSGLFRPNDTMTRAEVCALLAQALNLGMSGGNFFSDVPEYRWYAPSVNAMASLGLVNGVGNGKFDPYGTMTQQEFFTVMGRLAEYLSLGAWKYMKNAEASALSDGYNAYPSWARKSVSLLNEGIKDVNGEARSMLFDSLNNTAAGAAITREQAASTMYRTLTTLGCLSY